MKIYKGTDVQIHIFVSRCWMDVSGYLLVLATFAFDEVAPRYPLCRWLC
jgi:hypothetical protein